MFPHRSGVSTLWKPSLYDGPFLAEHGEVLLAPLSVWSDARSTEWLDHLNYSADRTRLFIKDETTQQCRTLLRS